MDTFFTSDDNALMGIFSVPRKLLELFVALMHSQYQHVNIAQMLYDREYSYEQLALAHTSANEALRELAVQLFKHYQA